MPPAPRLGAVSRTRLTISPTTSPLPLLNKAGTFMSARKIPAQGQRFGQLSFVEAIDSTFSGRLRGRFLCDCGTETIIEIITVRAGRSRSCGCLRRNTRIKNTRHGEATKKAHTTEYNSWISMRSRCRNPRNTDFALYGALGITVCDRWELYENFLADMGRKPFNHSLDRINPAGNYEPANCRWATPSVQSANQRRWQQT